MKNKKTQALVVSAVLVALSTVLSMVKLYEAPLGGSITLLSMLPICIVSIRYGVKWGLASSFVYSLFQLFLSLGEVLTWGLTPGILVGCIIFDYILAYTVIGLAGIFRNKGTGGVIGGITLALVPRFVSHFISGYVFFAKLDQWELFGTVFENKPVLYSIAYNGLYMLPELVLTVIAAVILCQIKGTRKLLLED